MLAGKISGCWQSCARREPTFQNGRAQFAIQPVGQGLMARPAFESELERANGFGHLKWSKIFYENGSVQCTTAAIRSVLKSRNASIVVGFWLLAKRLMGDQQMKVGVWFYGLGTALTGILDIAWGACDASHQPIKSLGKNLPGQHLLAYVAGVWLVAAGLAILWRRSARIGAAASAIAYLIFAALWLPRYP